MAKRASFPRPFLRQDGSVELEGQNLIEQYSNSEGNNGNSLTLSEK